MATTGETTSAVDIVDLSATDLAACVADGWLSCVEIMTAHLDRIDAVNPGLNAIVALRDRESLLAEALACDRRRARGDPLGPLHGLPIAVKDLQMVQGVRSTLGSPLFRDLIPSVDSVMVERLREAGAVIVGKTNTPEFGLGSHTFNDVYGATRNPYAPDRSCGGSSGGAAVALATRMLPLADGSDYGGSLRNPAGWNNVFGFRPSIGLTPSDPREVWLPSMGVVGPMARTVPDLALLLSVQAGRDRRLPLSFSPEGPALREGWRGGVRGVRIGWLGDFGGEAPCEGGVLELCEDALSALENLGCVVEPAAADHPIEPVWQALISLRSWQTGFHLLAHYEDPARRARLKPEAVWEIEAGARRTAYDIAAASAVRTAWTAAFLRLFERFDYLAAPTAQVFPFEIERRWPDRIGGTEMRTYHEWMKGVLLVSMSGCPSLAVPAGFSAGGLPMGVQLIAPHHAEAACLRLAHAYDEATGWVRRRPPPPMTPPPSPD